MSNMTILVADDGIAAREHLSSTLQKWGYEVIAVENGDLALMEVEKSDIKIALLDWVMPGICGPDLCRAIRAAKKDRYIYIMMITAKDKRENLIEGLISGADDYIIKPFDKGELQARLRNGQRIISLQEKLKIEQQRTESFAHKMEELANERALQLIHAERMATLGILSAGIAHEINNGLTSISLSIKTLEKTLQIPSDLQNENKSLPAPLATSIQQNISDIKTGINRISNIVHDMKHFSQKKENQIDDCDIAKCIETALQLSENKLKKRIVVTKEIPDNLPTIHANSQEIEQVFINLFVNSADATEALSSADLLIKAEYKANNIIITVADNGPGFSEAHLKRLFEPFFTTKTNEKGLGLGLSICRGIIEKYHGSINAENRPDGGALMKIYLPVL